MHNRVGVAVLLSSTVLLQLDWHKKRTCFWCSSSSCAAAPDKSPHVLHVDTLVIGGGICGISTALHLSKLGRKVMVVEREQIGGPFQASSVNSGILETFFDFNLSNSQTKPDPKECIKSYLLHQEQSPSSLSHVPSLSDLLMAGTMSLYDTLGDMHDIEYRNVGTIQVLENEEQYNHAKAHFASLEGDVKHVDKRAIKGRLIDRKTLRILEPWLTDEANHLLGGVLYPACGTIHPRKVMLALALEARKDGVNICEEAEVTSIQRKDSESGAGAGWICTMGYVPDRLQEPVQGSDSIIHAKEVVLAAGGMTDYMVSLVGNGQEGPHQLYRILDETTSAAVIPVVGQMFEAVPRSSSSTTSPKINHLIVGYESEMFWDSNLTVPPCVTHDHKSKERYCHHLYGKQTREGRFIFGGDRYVHPTMHPRLAHPLPRVLDKLFVGPYEHASRVLPCLNDMSVTNKWGGIHLLLLLFFSYGLKINYD